MQVQSASSSLAQHLAHVSIERASGYSGDEEASNAPLSLPSAYSESPTPSEHASQGSSLATMPYMEDTNSAPISQPLFGAPASHSGTIRTPSAYSNDDAYNGDSYVSPSPSPSPQMANAYASLPFDSAYVDSPTPPMDTGYSNSSYPYEAQSLPLGAGGYAPERTSSNSLFNSARSTGSGPSTPLMQSRSQSNESRTSSQGSVSSRSEKKGDKILKEDDEPQKDQKLLKIEGRNWTRDFYQVQSTISRGGSSLNPVEVMSQLSTMTAQFTADAVKYGTIIIREQMLPVAKKTIKPVGVGGIAGGMKFVHEGIFFKFPTNEADLYGNLENAMRGAGHELKGLTALINWELKTIGLHAIKFPLTAIVDYYGFRLVATAVLPLSSKTLVIGSGDAGRTIFDGTEKSAREPAKRLAELISDWGRYINVAAHDFTSTSLNRRVASVKICFDLEGHIGTDGNYYLCDFARTFPPADPHGVSGRFLYRLLRPEFVKKYRKPISSDSFMSGQVDKTLNITTKEASKYLTTEWLIEAVKVWNKTVNCVLPPKIITLLAHQSGINCRFLRLVAASVTDIDLKKSVNVEIVARTLKSVIRNEIRELQDPNETQIYQTIIKYFNLIFTDNDTSNEFWEKELQLEILKRFESPSRDFFDLAEKLLSAPSTPSGSPSPSLASSLNNSRSSISSPTQKRNKKNSKKSGEDDDEDPPFLSKSTRQNSAPANTRTRAKKSAVVEDTDDLKENLKSPKRTSKASAAKSPSKRSVAKSTTNNVDSHSTEKVQVEAQTAVRRSTRVRTVRVVTEPVPEWILALEANEEDDEDYVPSDSSGEESEENSESASDPENEGTDMPQRYEGVYGDTIPLAYGEEEDDVDEKPTKAKKSSAKKSYSNVSAKATASPSNAKKSSYEEPSSGQIDDSTPTPPMPMNYSDSSEIFGSPSSRDLQSTDSLPKSLSSSNSSGFIPTVRLDRSLGISRSAVHLEPLYQRLQQLLGFFLNSSADAKFQATLMHYKGDQGTRLVRLKANENNSSPTSSPSAPSSAYANTTFQVESKWKALESQDRAEVLEIRANSVFELSLGDVADYKPRIKQMFLTPFQTAFSWKKEADATEDFEQREDFLKFSAEAYLECLERNPLGDFALHNASRVFYAWLPFFAESNGNEARCVAYLAKRFAALAEKDNKDLANFKADIYKSSDMIEPRTGRVLTATQPEWCSDSLIKNLVLRKTELAEMVADILANANTQDGDENANNPDLELRIVLRDCYDQMFEELAVVPLAASAKIAKAKKTTASTSSNNEEKLIARKVALQYWKMIVAVITPSNPEMLDRLAAGLQSLPAEKAFLSKKHWEQAATFIF